MQTANRPALSLYYTGSYSRYNRPMKDRFSRLEARVEALVEGTFARLFAGHVHPRDVAVQLARALEDSAAAGAPATHYAVRLHPADARALQQSQPDIDQVLSDELLNLARQAGVTLPEPPQVSVRAEPNMTPHTVLVTAEGRAIAPSATQTMTPVRAAAPANAPKAFLIVDGEKTIVLDKPVLGLGRRFDNDIVVDDARVSRAHAQLRLRFGRYVVYDLGSTGGTFVNGIKVEECVLRAGDVISLGGIPLIYGEDTGGEDLPRQPNDRPSTPPHMQTRPFDSVKPPPKPEDRN
jgi:hypothetical protein